MHAETFHKSLIRLTLVTIAFVPKLAFAAGGTYMLLAPLAGLTTVNLTEYLSGMVRITIGVAGILAVLMTVICGVQMIGSPSVSQKSASKECITSAIFGLLLAIASWVILNTINEQLLSNEFTLDNLPTVANAPPPSSINDPMPTYPGFYFRYADGPMAREVNSPRFASPQECLAVLKSAPGVYGEAIDVDGVKCFQIFAPPQGVPPPPPGSPPIAGPADELLMRKEICGNTSCIGSKPVAIKQGPCPPGVGNCAASGYINVRGLPESVISELDRLGGVTAITLTGGTESGHKTHFPGRANFDLRKSTDLDNHVRTNATQSAASFDGCRYLLDGFWFTNEGDHWHICATSEPQWYCSPNDRAGNPLPAGSYINCPRQ